MVTGGARAAQTEHSGPKLKHNPHAAVALLLHGDAAFPSQGVVAETLNLQALDGYSTGGTVHLITDNQVGFTTDRDGRSTPYAGDMARASTIIHVNAGDVEACLGAVLAMAYREQWERDVVIDLIGYRRYGHNETDEPIHAADDGGGSSTRPSPSCTRKLMDGAWSPPRTSRARRSGPRSSSRRR